MSTAPHTEDLPGLGSEQSLFLGTGTHPVCVQLGPDRPRPRRRWIRVGGPPALSSGGRWSFSAGARDARWFFLSPDTSAIHSLPSSAPLPTSGSLTWVSAKQISFLKLYRFCRPGLCDNKTQKSILPFLQRKQNHGASPAAWPPPRPGPCSPRLFEAGFIPRRGPSICPSVLLTSL